MRSPAAIILTAVTAVLTATSCERRELWVESQQTAPVELLTDWSRFGEKPSGMTAVFYPTAGGSPLTFKTAHVERAEVSLPAGTYDALVFNLSEQEYAYELFRGMDRFATAEAYAYPEPMAADTLRNVTITPEMISETRLFPYEERNRIVHTMDGTQLYMQPQKVVWTLNIRVMIRGIQNMLSVTGAIDGLASGFLLGQHHANNVPMQNTLDDWAISRTRSASDSTGYITTSLKTFGLRPQDVFKDSDVQLTLRVILTDGKTVRTFHYNVANEIQISDGELILDLVIDADTHPADYPSLLTGEEPEPSDPGKEEPTPVDPTPPTPPTPPVEPTEPTPPPVDPVNPTDPATEPTDPPTENPDSGIDVNVKGWDDKTINITTGQ